MDSDSGVRTKDTSYVLHPYVLSALVVPNPLAMVQVHREEKKTVKIMFLSVEVLHIMHGFRSKLPLWWEHSSIIKMTGSQRRPTMKFQTNPASVSEVAHNANSFRYRNSIQ